MRAMIAIARRAPGNGVISSFPRHTLGNGVILLLSLLLVLPALAAAKSMVYVTHQQAAGLPCTELGGDDGLFCQRLEKLGYAIYIVTDNDVRDSSTMWQDRSAAAEMIFLGNVSADMVNSSLDDRSRFCASLNSAEKKIFATQLNTLKKGNLSGCVFRQLNMAEYPADNNVCTDKKLFVIQKNYVTRGFPLLEPVIVYSRNVPIKMSTTSGPLAVSCDPDGVELITDFYSAVSFAPKGTFWGMDSPGNYTPEGWRFFDRAVLFTTGDHVLNVSFFTVPKILTVNQTFMLFARVDSFTGPLATGSVNASLLGLPFGLAYNNLTGFWENRRLRMSRGGMIAVEAEDGESSANITAGQLDVRILSGNYQPGSYNIRAQPLLANRQVAAELNYRIFENNMTLVSEGRLESSEGIYSKAVELNTNGSLVLEVTGTTADGNGGGSYRYITSQPRAAGVTMEPAEWVITASVPGGESRSFHITTAQANLTGLRATAAKALASSLNISALPSNLSAGSSAAFTATLDWSALGEGVYEGEILVDSDQASLSVPVTLYYFNVSGDRLAAKQQNVNVQLPAGQRTTAKIMLTNVGNLPATKFNISAQPASIAAAVSLSSDIVIPARGEADLTLNIDARSLSEGSHTGTVKISSSAGEETITLNIQVGSNIGNMISSLRDDFEGLNVPASLKQLADSVNSSIQAAESALGSGDTSGAMNSYRAANDTLARLKKRMAEPKSDIVPVLIAVVLLVGIGAGVLYFLKRRRKKENEKEPEPRIVAEPDDKYHFPYYGEGEQRG